MRKLVFAINTTLDGVVDHMKIGPPDEETGEYFVHLTREAGTFLYGRKTYQLMVPYWPDVAKNLSGPPTARSEFARAFVAVGNIVVFSRSLDKVAGENTSIVRANLRDEILTLKQQEGKDIHTGGVDLASQLAALGLIDEYRIMVRPIIAGEGRRLFDGINLQEKLQLKLVGSKTFRSGSVLLHYVKQ